MTSFIISSHLSRPIPKSWKEDCPFCKIIQGKSHVFKIYEDELVIAFLDILPLRKGHTLVVPKMHIEHLSDLPEEIAAALGVVVSRVAKALTKDKGAFGDQNEGLNVVCNQEYAQAVPHVHYHVIPAPILNSSKSQAPSRRTMARLEFEAREELDEIEGEEIAAQIRAKL